MKAENVEKFMIEITDLYAKAHNAHMGVIDRYKRNLLSFEAYKELDNKYTIELETIAKISKMFLHCKNQ